MSRTEELIAKIVANPGDYMTDTPFHRDPAALQSEIHHAIAQINRSGGQQSFFEQSERILEHVEAIVGGADPWASLNEIWFELASFGQLSQFYRSLHSTETANSTGRIKKLISGPGPGSFSYVWVSLFLKALVESPQFFSDTEFIDNFDTIDNTHNKSSLLALHIAPLLSANEAMPVMAEALPQHISNLCQIFYCSYYDSHTTLSELLVDAPSPWSNEALLALVTLYKESGYLENDAFRRTYPWIPVDALLSVPWSDESLKKIERARRHRGSNSIPFQLVTGKKNYTGRDRSGKLMFAKRFTSIDIYGNFEVGPGGESNLNSPDMFFPIWKFYRDFAKASGLTPPRQPLDLVF